MKSLVEMRRTGRTTRMLWRTLLHASENPGSTTLVVAATAAHMDVIFGRLLELTRPVGPKASAVLRRVTLPNGAVVQVIHAEDRQRLRGLSPSTVVVDDHFAMEGGR